MLTLPVSSLVWSHPREKRALLFVGCDEGKATVLDLAQNGKKVAEAATGNGADIIAYAPSLGHLYAPGGDSATLTIFGVGTGVITDPFPAIKR
jgi:hypothetical protein